MITKLKNIFNFLLEKLSIELFSFKDYSLTLYQLTLAILVLFSGILFIKILLGKIKKWKFLVDLDKQAQSVPIIRLLRIIMYLLLIMGFFSVLGVPVSLFLGFWNYGIYSIGENAITIGKVTIGLLFFFFAFRMNKMFKPKTDEYISKVLKLDFSTRATVITIIEYLFLFIIVLFTLSIIGIPMTAFTVVGGTLAIGVGFGSQNLINNFLSGFVLMGERTTKIGDIIEVQGNLGIVEKIGFRSTVIKTFSNLRLIIPNSALLENNVINWSLNDKLLRRKVTIGVAYGADADQVLTLLKDCAMTHEDIMNTPEPFVIFSDFGDSALIFDIYFFVEMGGSRNAMKIESELRVKVYKELKKAKITIPFPQQDVYFYPTKPIDINIKSKDKT